MQQIYWNQLPVGAFDMLCGFDSGMDFYYYQGHYYAYFNNQLFARWNGIEWK